MAVLEVYIDGIGFWSEGAADWSAAADVLTAGRDVLHGDASRPPAVRLPPAERRRAPAPVLIAVEAATQAAAMADRDPAALPSVFASTHGDVAITDEMCATLADSPLTLSPTRFHNSVHNAPAGYWTVAAGCHRAATAISAEHASFAACLLEAAIEAHDADESVLAVAYDIRAAGPLGEVAASASPFAIALVLSPRRSPSSRAALSLEHRPRADDRADAEDVDNPMAAQALPLLRALADGRDADLVLRAGTASALAIRVSQ